MKRSQWLKRGKSTSLVAMQNGPVGARPPSIRDVATVAAVSYQTVSRVINDQPHIRAATKQRVLDAMSQLNYRPNRAARKLAARRSQSIGVVATIHGSYFGPTSIVSATEEAAREHGYATLLASPQDADASSVADAIEHLVAEGVDGILIIAPQLRTVGLLKSIETPIPIVLLQAHGIPAEAGPSVDNALGAAIAVRHLVALGHRTIAMVAGPPDWTEAEERRISFQDTLAGFDLSAAAIVEGDWTADSGYQAYQKLHGRQITAVFCANDQMSLGLIHAASDRGVSVPSDLSVIGFDDVPEAAHYLPPLTTIKQDFAELGRRAIATLLERLSAEPTQLLTPISPKLIVRASTMPRAGRDVHASTV